MLTSLSKNWWLFLIRGILAIAFGLLTLLAPALTLVLLVAFFGAYAIVDGAAAIFTSFSSRASDPRWWMHLLEGSVGVVAGLIALFWPEIAAVTLLLVIAAWSVLTGITEIMSAIRLRKEIDNEWWLGLSGLLSVVFGIYVFLFPGAGALALAWLIGFYAIFFGATFIGLALRLRQHHQSTPQQPSSRATA
ncbi:MAG: HdeD family acid-resistance protein [Anaerolineae bacterium]|nr:HdeD family acid-resistance protein [Anaerolineae bacterium]